MNSELSKEELSRYARHLTLPEVGKAGQERLKNGSVLIIGVGGLGSPAALYLAAAGVGRIGIVDFDIVDETNLQRQILYATDDSGKSKADSAKEKLLSLNPNIEIEIYNEKLTSKNALEILKNYDVVLDGSDNFPARYLVNDACVLLNKPFVYGAILRFEGHASVFNYQNGPTYRCLFPNPPPANEVPSCGQAGVLGVLPGVIGTIQATEVLKILLGKGITLSGRLLIYNALDMSFKELKLKKNPHVPEIKELIDYDEYCSDASSTFVSRDEITTGQLKELLEEKTDMVLLDVREEPEWESGKINDNAIEVSFMEVYTKNEKTIEKLASLDKSKPIIAYCHTGARSAFVVNLLKEKGFDAKNLVGGIDAWAKEADTSA